MGGEGGGSVPAQRDKNGRRGWDGRSQSAHSHTPPLVKGVWVSSPHKMCWFHLASTLHPGKQPVANNNCHKRPKRSRKRRGRRVPASDRTQMSPFIPALFQITLAARQDPWDGDLVCAGLPRGSVLVPVVDQAAQRLDVRDVVLRQADDVHILHTGRGIMGGEESSRPIVRKALRLGKLDLGGPTLDPVARFGHHRIVVWVSLDSLGLIGWPIGGRGKSWSGNL